MIYEQYEVNDLCFEIFEHDTGLRKYKRISIGQKDDNREGYDYEHIYGFDLKDDKVTFYIINEDKNHSSSNSYFLDMENLKKEEKEFFLNLLDMFQDEVENKKISDAASNVFYEIINKVYEKDKKVIK